MSCLDNCKACPNSTFCSECNEGYNNFDGECGIDCPPGHDIVAPDQCGEVCGDGVRRSELPYCDDGNV